MDSTTIAATVQQLLDAISELRQKQARYEMDYSNNKDAPTGTVATAPHVCIADPAVHSQLAKLNSMSSALNELEERVTSLTKVVGEKVAKLEKTAQEQASKLDELEQYSRRNCLILHGCPKLTEVSTRNSYSDMELFVLNKLNSNLNLDFVISPEEIDILHPLPSRRATNPIIIRFVRRSVRHAVYVNKAFLKGTFLSITESLTKRRLELLKSAQLAIGFKNVWTWNGIIYGMNETNQRRVTIKCENDVQKLLN